MTSERLLASKILNFYETRRVFIGDLDACDQELFDKVLEQSANDVVEDWVFEGAINLYCRQGSVLIYGSNVI